MATYYATKNYVCSLTGAVRQELLRRHSKVKVTALCPGPVDTEFNDVANVRFSAAPITPRMAAEQGLDGVMKGKMFVVPSFKMKSVKFMKRLMPDPLTARICYHAQKKKKRKG